MRKAYSKKGDEGFTTDFSGAKISKDDKLMIAIGKLDSLQSIVDLAILKSSNKEILEWVQRKLWQTAGELASANTKVVDPVTAEDLVLLEKYTDSFGEPPTKFVRFDTELAIIFNECRVRCRELETHLVRLLREEKINPIAYQWINRLSSLFFIMAYSSRKN